MKNTDWMSIATLHRWHWLAVWYFVLCFCFVFSTLTFRGVCSFGFLFLKCFKCQSENERLSEKPNTLNLFAPTNKLYFFFVLRSIRCARALLTNALIKTLLSFCPYKKVFFFIQKTRRMSVCLREVFWHDFANFIRKQHKLELFWKLSIAMPFPWTTISFKITSKLRLTEICSILFLFLFLCMYRLILSWKFSDHFACK